MMDSRAIDPIKYGLFNFPSNLYGPTMLINRNINDYSAVFPIDYSPAALGILSGVLSYYHQDKLVMAAKFRSSRFITEMKQGLLPHMETDGFHLYVIPINSGFWDNQSQRSEVVTELKEVFGTELNLHNMLIQRQFLLSYIGSHINAKGQKSLVIMYELPTDLFSTSHQNWMLKLHAIILYALHDFNNDVAPWIIELLEVRGDTPLAKLINYLDIVLAHYPQLQEFYDNFDTIQYQKQIAATVEEWSSGFVTESTEMIISLTDQQKSLNERLNQLRIQIQHYQERVFFLRNNSEHINDLKDFEEYCVKQRRDVLHKLFYNANQLHMNLTVPVIYYDLEAAQLYINNLDDDLYYKLLKAIFLNNKITLYFQAIISVTVNGGVFIDTPDDAFRMPNPHIASYSCYAAMINEISAAYQAHNYIGMLEQAISGVGNLNFFDGTVMRAFLGYLSTYNHLATYKYQENFYTFDEILDLIHKEDL